MPYVRPLGVVLLLLLAACPGDVPPRDGADASIEDTPDGGGSTPDAPLGIDARPIDARPPDASNVDAAVSCSFQGRSGTCITMAACGSGNQWVSSAMGATGCQALPNDIRCCVPPAFDSDPGAACNPSERPEPNDGLTEEPGVEGCPPGMLRVATDTGSFCIDRFEASLERVHDDGSTSSWSPYFTPGTTRVIARSLRGAVPQGYITGTQASAACAEAGKRLCSDTEWLRACRGPSNLTFPYGPTRQPGVCNDARHQHPAVELFGSVTNLTSPCINQLQPGLERTAARTGCVTAEGAMDMMGNLHEWTADPAGTFRGGFYVDTTINMEGCLYRTTAHNTAYQDYSTGFRCCAD